MAPAANEIEKGEPFVGRAGTVLSRILKKVGPREEFVIYNALQCRPPNDNFSFEEEAEAINFCLHQYVKSYHQSYSTSVRVSLGAVPFKALTGSDVPITKARGYRFETEEGPVIATYHPSFLGRGKMNLIPVVIWDLTTALRERSLPPLSYPLSDLTLFPSPDEFREWARLAQGWSSFIALDLETEDSRGDEEDLESESLVITRASLARDDFKAITFPWQEPFVGILVELLGSKIPVVTWNGHEFDLPRLYENGITVHGYHMDAMWLWHHLSPTLPRGLGFVSTFYDRVPEWKSIGSAGGWDDELYSCMDARQTAKNFVGIKKALEGRRV